MKKQPWTLSYDVGDEALIIETDEMEDGLPPIQIHLDPDDLPEPEDETWEEVIQRVAPHIWGLAQTILKALNTPTLDPKEFKVTELMDGEYNVISDRGHEFLLTWPDGEREEPDHVELGININSVSVGFPRLSNGIKKPFTGNLDSLFNHLEKASKGFLIPQDIELIKFLSTLEGFSYHVVECEEGLWVTVWLPIKVFKEHFGHLDLEL